jgi:signal transduction histidine kinase
LSGETDLERRVANLERLVQVNRTLRSAFDLPSLLQQVIESVTDLAHCETASIMLVSPDTGQLEFAASGSDLDLVRDAVVPRAGSIAGAIVETGQPLVVDDVYGDPRFYSQIDTLTGHTTRSIVGVPLEVGGRVIGVLQALNKLDGRFDGTDVETLQMFASQAAVAIENTQLIEEQRERLSEAVLQQDVVLALSRFIRMDQLLDQLLVLLEEWLGYQNCAVLMYDQDRGALEVAAYRGLGGGNVLGSSLVIDGNTASGRAAMSQSPLRIDDLADAPGLRALLPGTQSLLSVPLLCGEDSGLVGVISLESPDAEAFSERDARILTAIGTHAAIGIRQASLYDASRRANRLKQEFITTMSHELRTPLTVLIGYCDMLADGSLGPVEDDQLSALRVMRNRSDLLLQMLNNVLDYSRIASGNLELELETVDLRAAIDGVVARHSAAAERRHQRVTTEVPAMCRHVIADEARLRQILGHLLENALKFSPEGRPVIVRATPHDADYVRVDVVDKGIGIRTEDLDAVFEDFRQVDGSFTREYGGIGLGLSIARHLVELQGGLIWVESTYSEGSTFSFLLPRQAVSQSPPSVPTC